MQEDLPARKKKRAHRGTRSIKSKNERLIKYVNSKGPERARKVINNRTGKNFGYDEATRLISKVEIHHPSHYPSEFVHAPKDRLKVRTTVRKEYPDSQHPENYPVLPSNPDGILLTPTPPSTLVSDPQHPPYMILRLISIVSERTQSELLAAWDQVKATSPKIYIKDDDARSITPAYHFGIWEVTSRVPHVTRETRDQTANAILAIDKLLRLIKAQVLPKIISMMKEYLPVQWAHQQR